MKFSPCPPARGGKSAARTKTFCAWSCPEEVFPEEERLHYRRISADARRGGAQDGRCKAFGKSWQFLSRSLRLRGGEGLYECVYSSNGDPFYSECADYDVTLKTDEKSLRQVRDRRFPRRGKGSLSPIATSWKTARDFALVLGEEYECNRRRRTGCRSCIAPTTGKMRRKRCRSCPSVSHIFRIRSAIFRTKRIRPCRRILFSGHGIPRARVPFGRALAGKICCTRRCMKRRTSGGTLPWATTSASMPFWTRDWRSILLPLLFEYDGYGISAADRLKWRIPPATRSCPCRKRCSGRRIPA